MSIITRFIKRHWKKILIAVILFVITFGLSALYKLIKGGRS